MNWIVCVLSNSDLSSFKDKILLSKFANKIKQNEIKIIIIIFGDQKEKLMQKFQRSLVMLEDPIFLLNPTTKEIEELIASISNVVVNEEDLIFEKFRDTDATLGSFHGKEL